MTVSEFIKFWSKVNKTQMNTKYYYKNKLNHYYSLINIEDILQSIKISVTQEALNNSDIIIDSTWCDLSYNQTQFLKTLRAQAPMGSYVYTLNIFIE